MKVLFFNLINMSIVASWLILAVIIFRLIFKKAPRWIMTFMWCLVGIRLACPLAFDSPVSIIPSTDTLVVSENSLTVDSGLNPMDSAVNAYLMQAYTETGENSISNSEHIVSSSVTTVLTYVWLAGVMLLLVGSLISYIRLKIRLSDAVRYEGNIYQTEKINSPFVFGMVRPRIYVPYYLETDQLDCVVLHEKTHIKRLDHIVKPLGYVLLAVHWFNPLVWVAFILLCRDIELACDERVIKSIGFDKKRLYSETLLECSIPRKVFLAYPIAFAEVSVKERIKNVMKMKKYNKVVVAGAIASAAAVAVICMTNPSRASEDRRLSTPIYENGYTVDASTDESVSEVVAASDESQSTVPTEESQSTVTTEESKSDGATNSADQSAATTIDSNANSTEQPVVDDANNSTSTNEQTVQDKVDETEKTKEEEAEHAKEETTVESNAQTTVADSASVKLMNPVMGGGIMTMGYSDAHKGIDLAAGKGTPLVASFSGTVTATGFDAANGNYIVITDAAGWSVYYNHCDTVSVAVNDTVEAGAEVGTLGTTGNVTGPALHFAVTDPNGNFCNPGTLY